MWTTALHIGLVTKYNPYFFLSLSDRLMLMFVFLLHLLLIIVVAQISLNIIFFIMSTVIN